MMKRILLILFTIASLFYYGCSCACGEDALIPDAVMRNANQVIISRTGKEYFEQYISLDLKQSKQITPDYYLVYNLRMPEKPYVNETIEFTVDSAGNLNNDFKVKGIPDCFNGDCEFVITEQKAIEIAEKNNFEKGIKEWLRDFSWSDEHNCYVWKILTVKSESENSQGKKSSGREIIIDANSGEVLANNEWFVR